jgi:hypothetical protein
MINARKHHTAVLLTNGKVLVSGGQNAATLRSAELYNPSVGTWTLTSSMNDTRALHTASRLTNDKVLIVGGSINGTIYLNSAELY